MAIDTPNWYVIQSLINHGYATEFNNHLVISAIPLTFPFKKADKLTDSEVDVLKKMGVETENMKSLQINTHIYDKNILGCVDFTFKLVSGICDEDLKHRSNLVFDRMIDPVEYFSGLEDELKELTEKGVLSYG